jgi:UDP-galactopyranose mutase
MEKEYDYVIVGSGLFGATFAYEATQRGKKCLVIDKRNHIAGNIFTNTQEGINVHQYGPHIFHTNDKGIWDYVNQFVSFNRFTYTPMANYKGKYYNLPFNMNTFNQLWGTTTPEAAKAKIAEQIQHLNIEDPKNLEEQALKLVGTDIYEKLIKGYTEKQWGRSATELPAFIIKRLPVRFIYDNNYFNDSYQGIPIGGYTKIVAAMLQNIEVRLETDFFANKEYFLNLGKKIVYTGPLDQYFNFSHGHLAYRSLRFETSLVEKENYQGNAAINYTDSETPYTRIIEHKHFEFGTQANTIITKEYPLEWQAGAEPYYPINDDLNMKVFKAYQQLTAQESQIIFGGRLAEYRYYDMHQVIASALVTVKKELV